jgi:hypothetical protein
LISDDSAEAASEYLRDNAARYGQLRGHAKYADGNLRRVKALVMLELEGGLGERETKAYASPEYHKALEEMRDAEAAYVTESAMREAAQYRIDVWRSQNKARGQG